MWVELTDISRTTGSPTSAGCGPFRLASNCEPARLHYRQRRKNGDHHAAATRHLFNKLRGQLYQQTFDETKAFPKPPLDAAA
jgi:hypothetical protein